MISMDLYIYVIFIAVIILAIVLALLLARNDKQRREIEELKKQRSEIEFQARQKALRLLQDAREKGMQIILEATTRAGKDQNNITLELTKVAEQQQEIYKQMLQNISKSVGDEAVREINNLTNVLESETSGVQKLVSQKLEEEYKSISVEIENYKSQKLKDINSRLRDMLLDISRVMIGKNINQDDHTELILKLLNETKQKHGF